MGSEMERLDKMAALSVALTAQRPFRAQVDIVAAAILFASATTLQ